MSNSTGSLLRAVTLDSLSAVMGRIENTLGDEGLKAVGRLEIFDGGNNKLGELRLSGTGVAFSGAWEG